MDDDLGSDGPCRWRGSNPSSPTLALEDGPSYVADVRADLLPALTLTGEPEATPADMILTGALGLWALGAAIGLFHLLRGRRALAHVLRDASRAGSEMDQIAQDAARNLGLGNVPRVLISTCVSSPFSLGLGWLVHTPVTPNQVSAVATLVGVGSAFLFAQGTHGTAVAGAALLQVSAVIDCVDGDIARVCHKESAAGKWADLVGDQIVHVCVFAGIGIGMARRGSDAPVLALGISAALGVLASFVVVVRGMRSPDSRLRGLLDATANRDFSVVLLLLALVDGLGVFLWCAGIGVHVFWIAALTLLVVANRAPGRGAPSSA